MSAVPDRTRRRAVDPVRLPPAASTTARSPAVGSAAAGTGTPAGREHDPVELVDDTGRPVGTATVARAHTAPGELHRAFSVLLLDAAGAELLLQRRADVKTRFPRRWANTCCGHPAPGEPVTEAATRRLEQELGLRDGLRLTEVGVYRYRAVDPATGRVEHEYDHVLMGRYPGGRPPRPDPAEVSELSWVSRDELFRLLDRGPEVCVPWLAGVVGTLATVVTGWSR